MIVGGGTAGWLAAASLARHLDIQKDIHTTITLVESPDKSPIGVGEGTWPTMRQTLRKIGIDETEFLRECDASFKQGTHFVNWHQANSDDSDVSFYHSFELPRGMWQTPPGAYWQHLHAELGIAYAEAISPQPSACQANLAPKTLSTPAYEGILNYAYHLDAGKFAGMLSRFATRKLGVTHIKDHVTDVIQAEDGYIRALNTRASGEISGDLFIDCSGFSSLLLDQTYKIPFRTVSNTLLVNSAVAMQVPYTSSEAPIASPTLSTAQKAGWIWDIGLQSRRGTGHVYSDNHMSAEEAEFGLRRYIQKTIQHSVDNGYGPLAGHRSAEAFVADLDARYIKMRLGYREKVMHKNCVAIGLSAAFLEPLEASAIFLIEASCNMLAELFPRNRAMLSALEKKYNATFIQRWQRVVDFIKLHYMLSRRRDSDFWLDNVQPQSVPDSLQEQLEFWQHYPPSRFDLPSALEPFVRESYEFILYGMGYHTRYAQGDLPLPHLDYARENFARIAQMRGEVANHLTSNRELLNQIREYRFPTT